MTLARKGALILSIAFHVGKYLFIGSPIAWMHLIKNLPFPSIAVLEIINSAANGVIILELLRLVIPSSSKWGEKRHFQNVALISLVLLALTLSGLYLWKARGM